MDSVGIVHTVFSYKDKKLGSFSKPVVSDQTKEVYTRGAIRAAYRAEGVDKAYAKDQALYYLGTFDDGTGKFDLLDDPEKVVDLEDYLGGKAK